MESGRDMPVQGGNGRNSGPPTWEAHTGRPRVLIEHADPDTRERLEVGLRARGYDTLACPGPGQRDGCPLVGQTICPAAAQADVVVTGLADDGPGRVVATTIGYHYPGRPLLIEGGPEVRRNLDPALHDHLVERLEVDDIVALAESAS